MEFHTFTMIHLPIVIAIIIRVALSRSFFLFFFFFLFFSFFLYPCNITQGDYDPRSQKRKISSRMNRNKPIDSVHFQVFRLATCNRHDFLINRGNNTCVTRKIHNETVIVIFFAMKNSMLPLGFL